MSPRVTTRTLPAIQLIIPELHGVPFDGPAWLFEPKYDGFRGLLHITATHAAFTSKRGLLLKRFDQLARQVRDQLGVRDAILNGEVLAMDPSGHVNFLLLMRGQGDLHYAAFDLLWLNGRDFRSKPLSERKRRLERLIPEARPGLSRVLTVPKEGGPVRGGAAARPRGHGGQAEGGSLRARVTWYKIENGAYSQMEGRGELFSRAAMTPEAAWVVGECALMTLFMTIPVGKGQRQSAPLTLPR
jgi:hypothetical protein